MHEVKIQIQNKFFRKKKCFLFPASFSDLNFDQWTAYHQYVLQHIGEAELLWIFLSGNEKFKLKIPGERIADIEYLTYFIHSEPSPEWYMKFVVLNGVKLIGPASEFKNMVCGEFVFADTYYTSFKETEDENFLNKFLAVLMREIDSLANETSPAWKGDNRIIFNENHIDRRAALISKMPLDKRLAAAFNYSIIRELLEKRYIWIFQKSSAESNSKSSGWDKVIRSMCFGDITKLQEIFFVPLYTFFDELNDAIRVNP